MPSIVENNIKRIEIEMDVASVHRKIGLLIHGAWTFGRKGLGKLYGDAEGRCSVLKSRLMGVMRLEGGCFAEWEESHEEMVCVPCRRNHRISLP